MENAILLLKDPEIFPTNEVLKATLNENYGVFTDFIDVVTDADLGVDLQWNYYKDGKSWLGKAIHKKKTVFWLSVWDKCFKVSLFFTEKTREGVMLLDIDSSIKERLKNTEIRGKLITLIFDIDNQNQLKDLIKVVEYKKNLK